MFFDPTPIFALASISACRAAELTESNAKIRQIFDLTHKLSKKITNNFLNSLKRLFKTTKTLQNIVLSSVGSQLGNAEFPVRECS